MTPASGRTADNASFGEMHDALRTALADEAVNLAVSLTEAVLADGLGFKGPFEEFGRIAEPLLLDALGAARRDGAQIANEAAAPILAQLRSDLAAARKESADYTAVVEQALRDKDEQNASLRSQLQEAQKALKPFAQAT